MQNNYSVLRRTLRSQGGGSTVSMEKSVRVLCRYLAVTGSTIIILFPVCLRSISVFCSHTPCTIYCRLTIVSTSTSTISPSSRLSTVIRPAGSLSVPMERRCGSAFLIGPNPADPGTLIYVAYVSRRLSRNTYKHDRVEYSGVIVVYGDRRGW